MRPTKKTWRSSAATPSRVIAEHCPDIIWEISHVVADEEGRITTFCIYSAPDEDRVPPSTGKCSRHATSSIYEIGGQVSPADFPYLTTAPSAALEGPAHLHLDVRGRGDRGRLGAS